MSIIKHKSQRVAVLIDVQNMYHSAKNLFRSRVNFNEILKTAVGGRQLIRAIAYVIRTESGEEKTFFEALTKMGVETKVKDLQIFAGGVKKADCDEGMAVDAVSLSEKVDALVLVTGDGDFVPLVEFLKGGRAQAEIMAFGRSTSQRLKEAADDFTDLGEDQKYLIKSKR